MMKIILAGYNIEAEMVAEAEKRIGAELTPEVISAAYARISRDPRNVDTLRREARGEVDKARRSNEKIVFGMGHSSVAEHAVFNFDVMGVSRLAVEEIQSFRLASFTEKSQRYIRLGKDHIVPEEIEQSGLAGEFSGLLEALSDAYEAVYARILEIGADKGVAREDARYLMPLATSAQFGMTVNAREAEYMISRLGSHWLSELRKFSERLSSIAVKEAPSLVRYTEPSPYFTSRSEKRERIKGLTETCFSKVPLSGTERVNLVDWTKSGDAKLAAGLVFCSTRCPYSEALRAARSMGRKDLRRLIHSTFEDMRPHDSAWREFESINMLFEVVVSASCYAQLKRHRMTSQLVQSYDLSMGCSIPASVAESGSLGIFRKAIARSQSLYRKLAARCGRAGEYALTNAHRRRVLVGMNMRELYHFSRLRSDSHAQWEIRELSEKMCALAKARFPVASTMLAGKDGFEESAKRIDS